jgi:serine/threonine protein kinase/tetratricopeptide (TPR) repeat protein
MNMNEETLFQKALELSQDQRAAFLDRECPDPVLRARVEALLAADEASEILVDQSFPKMENDFRTGPNVQKNIFTPKETEGTLIAGRYKLLQQIGEGGMGTVWMADQLEPIKRKVAIKLIRVERGDSKTILARFEAERQAIALMDHPHIAKLLDAGTTEDGAPFFVMELVKGIPLNQYCDQHRLSIPERLNLFIQICSAVQHAHQKGIIHRDLKPSNILVESHEGKPVPKIIDFGLAKATTGMQLTEQSLFTAIGTVLGTPLYMAPEQASFNAIDIDTRADVYALGVILYELLTGTTPITREAFKHAALDEMLRLIREQEAPTPSSRLSSDDRTPTVAANRQIEPAKLGRFIKGELDWIVMKALSKERDRRYETAKGFARDIERFLNHEPVSAGPPSAAYRLRKFVRRNRPQVIAASLVVLALVAGVVGTTLGLLEARHQAEIARGQQAEAIRQAEVARAEAEAKEQARAEEANQRAEAERQRSEAERQRALAEERLTQVTAEKQRADEEKRIATAVKDFLQNKLLAQAAPVEQANHLLRVGLLVGEMKYNPTIHELLDRTAKELAPDKIEGVFPKQPLVQAEILRTVGTTYCGIGEAGVALDFLIRSVELFRRHLGSDHPETLTSMNNLALVYHDLGKLDQALPLLEETLKLRKAKLGTDHPDTLTSMNNLAACYWSRKQLDKSMSLYEETLKLLKAKLGPEHPHTLLSMNNLAGVYFHMGKLDQSLPLQEELLQLMKAKFGPEHPHTLLSMNNLAVGYWSRKQLDKSVAIFEQLLPIQQKKLGREHPNTQFTVANLGVNYNDTGRLAEAIPLLEEAYRSSKKYPVLRWVGDHLLEAYTKAGKRAETQKLIHEIQADARKHLPKDSPQLAGLLAQFGLMLFRLNSYAEAEPLLRESLAIYEMLKHDSWVTFNIMSLLGEVLLAQKKYTDAEPFLLKGYEGMKAREKNIPPHNSTRIPEVLGRLIELYTAMNKPDEVKKYRELRAKISEPTPLPKEKP